MSRAYFRKALPLIAPMVIAGALIPLSLSASEPAPAAAAAPASAPASAPAPASAAAPASAPAPAPASAPASASASAPAEPDAPSIGDWSPPDSASDKPTEEEWEKATALSLIRPYAQCKASVLREWVRLSCNDPSGDFKGLRVLGGSEKDVSILDYKVKVRKFDEYQNKEIERELDGIHIMFPVRRGDRRVMAIVTGISAGWKSWTLLEGIDTTISELWLPGEAHPAIVVY